MLYLSNKSHISAVVWGSGDATMELGVNVACVTHASLMRAMMCDDQIFVGTKTLSRSNPEEVRNEEETSTGDN
jgi:hypothetical protein